MITPTQFVALLENNGYECLQQARRDLTGISVRLNSAVERPDVETLHRIRRDLTVIASKLASCDHPSAEQAERLIDQAREQLFNVEVHHEAPKLSGLASNAEKLVDEARRFIFDLQESDPGRTEDLRGLLQLAKGVQARNDPAEIASFLENRDCTIEEYIKRIHRMMRGRERSRIAEANATDAAIPSTVKMTVEAFNSSGGWRVLLTTNGSDGRADDRLGDVIEAALRKSGCKPSDANSSYKAGSSPLTKQTVLDAIAGVMKTVAPQHQMLRYRASTAWGWPKITATFSTGRGDATGPLPKSGWTSRNTNPE